MFGAGVVPDFIFLAFGFVFKENPLKKQGFSSSMVHSKGVMQQLAS